MDKLVHRVWTQKGLLHELECIRAEIAPFWTDDTAYKTRKSGTPPSTGQCAVTAAILCNQLGGELISTTVNGYSHWLNRIDGFYCDITGDQFGYPYASVFCSETWPYIHDPVVRPKITDPDTKARTRLLAESAGFPTPLRVFNDKPISTPGVSMPTDLPNLEIQRHPLLDKDNTIRGSIFGLNFSLTPQAGSKLARILDILFEEPSITSDDLLLPKPERTI